MRVKHVMTQHPVCCRTSDSAQHAARILRDENVGSLPVIANDASHELVGIITDRDLCCSIVARGLDPTATPLEQLMKRHPISCRAEQSLDACGKLMRAHRVRRIPVVDEQGRCVGIVSQADLARVEEAEKVRQIIAEISKPDQAIILAAALVQRAS